MKRPHRRQFLHLAAGATTLPSLSRVARAQAYPARPVRLIVPFAPGGGTDIAARLIGQWLSERLSQQFIIDNRPGAGSNLGTETVVNAPPDGYTLLLISAAGAINASLYERLSFNFIRDIAPVAGISRSPNVLVVHPSVPVKTVVEFIAYGKTNPAKLNMASGGSGTAQHVAGELFKMMTGTNMVHIPYRGSGPAVTDVIGGQVQVMFGDMSSSIEHIRAGRLRALGVTTAARSAALPDLPTIAEFVPGYEASTWFGIGMPKNASSETIGKLNRDIGAALADPRIEARLADLGGVPMRMTPGELEKLIAEETEKWARVVKFSGAKPD